MDKTVKHSADPVDLFDLIAWFHANRSRVISISAAVLIVGAVVGGYFWHKNYNESQAAEALSNVKPPATAQEAANPSAADAQPFLKVADEYPGTRAGARALLVAGGILFDAGKFDQAQSAFDKFMQQYPENTLANEALLGVAASLEAQGKIAEATSHYDDLIKRHQADSTTPQAKSALARLYVAQSKPELALRLYEELARANANDSWSAEAGIQIQELLAKYPNLRKPAPGAAPPPASSAVTVPTPK